MDAIIFGCGETALKYSAKIKEQFHVIAYTSNNPNSWGKEMDGVKIIPPTQFPEDAAVVVASESYYPEIIYGLAQDSIRPRQIYTVLEGEIIQYCPPEIGSSVEGLEFEYPGCKASPILLQLGFSSVCNSRCRHCIYHSEYSTYTFHQGFMSEDTLNEVIRQVKPVDSFKSLLLISDGETMMHPHWYEFASRVLNECHSFEDCKIYTNGMLLTRENAEKLKRIPVQHLRLVISIDGTSPEDCEYWRKGEKFSVVRENVNRAYEILGDNVEFIISSCEVLPASINAASAPEVEEFLKQSQKWREEEFPFAHQANGLALPLIANIPGTQAVPASIYPRACICTNPFIHIAVLENGDIVSCPCGYVFKEEQNYRIGNVKKDNLLDVFYNHAIFRQLRDDLLHSRKPQLCGACSQLGGARLWCLQTTAGQEG